MPALRASQVDLIGTLKEGGRSATRSFRGSRLAQGLVAAELALSIVLLIGASLLIRSYLALSDVDLGYDRDGVLTWRVTLAGASHPDDASRFELLVRDRATLDAAARRLAAAEVRATQTEDGFAVDDPWGTRVLLRAA